MKAKSGRTKRKDCANDISSTAPNTDITFNFSNQRRLSIGEIKRNHKLNKKISQTPYICGSEVSENLIKDSEDYEVYFNQKQERKRFGEMKIYQEFHYNDDRKLRDDKTPAQTEKFDSLQIKKQDNSLRIVLPPCTNHQSH